MFNNVWGEFVEAFLTECVADAVLVVLCALLLCADAVCSPASFHELSEPFCDRGHGGNTGLAVDSSATAFLRCCGGVLFGTTRISEGAVDGCAFAGLPVFLWHPETVGALALVGAGASCLVVAANTVALVFDAGGAHGWLDSVMADDGDCIVDHYSAGQCFCGCLWPVFGEC